MYLTSSLEVQPPFLYVGLYRHHPFFSKGLSSSKRNHHFFKWCWTSRESFSYHFLSPMLHFLVYLEFFFRYELGVLTKFLSKEVLFEETSPTPWNINGWNLKITQLKSGTSSEPRPIMTLTSSRSFSGMVPSLKLTVCP